MPDDADWNIEIDSATRDFLRGYFRFVLSYTDHAWASCFSTWHELVHTPFMADQFVAAAIVALREGQVTLPTAAERVVLATAARRGAVKYRRGWNAAVAADEIEYDGDYDAAGMVRDVTRGALGRAVLLLTLTTCGRVLDRPAADLAVQGVQERVASKIGDWIGVLFPATESADDDGWAYERGRKVPRADGALPGSFWRAR